MDVDLHRSSNQDRGRGRTQPTPKQQPGPRSRQNANVAHILQASDARNCAYRPYDEQHAYRPYDDDLECLPRGATDEERRKNCDVLEEKKMKVQDAIDNPEKLPERIGLARKRIKWLNKQIAKEKRMLTNSRNSRISDQLKYDKQMERQRTAKYEKADAAHRKRFPPSELQLKLEREGAYRMPIGARGLIRTPKKIIDALRAERIIEEQSATAVAASSSSSSTGAASAAMSSEPLLTRDDQLLRDAIDETVCMTSTRAESMTGRWEEAP